MPSGKERSLAEKSRVARLRFKPPAPSAGINGLFSGRVVAVPGWAPGTSTNYIVFGWSGQHDLSPQWFGGIHPFIFGGDGPANGVAGNGSTIPVLNLFDGGPGTIPQGIFQLQNYLVPEPSAAALGMIGAGIVVASRRVPDNRKR